MKIPHARSLDLFMAIGGLLVLMVSGYMLWKAYSSTDWPVVEATITSSVTRKKAGASSLTSTTTYRVTVTYEYWVNDVRYTQTSRRTLYRSQLDSYGVGDTMLIFYYPNYPRISVLERGAHSGHYLPIAVAFLLTGRGVFGLLRWRASRQREVVEPG